MFTLASVTFTLSGIAHPHADEEALPRSRAPRTLPHHSTEAPLRDRGRGPEVVDARAGDAPRKREREIRQLFAGENVTRVGSLRGSPSTRSHTPNITRIFHSPGENRNVDSPRKNPSHSRKQVAVRTPTQNCRPGDAVSVTSHGSDGSRIYAHPCVQHTSRRLSVRSGRNTRLAPTRRRATHTTTHRAHLSRTYPPFDRRGAARPRLSVSVPAAGTTLPRSTWIYVCRHSESARADRSDRHAGQALSTAVEDSKTCHSPRAAAGRTCADVHGGSARDQRDPAELTSEHSKYIAFIAIVSPRIRGRTIPRVSIRRPSNPNLGVGTRARARAHTRRRRIIHSRRDATRNLTTTRCVALPVTVRSARERPPAITHRLILSARSRPALRRLSPGRPRNTLCTASLRALANVVLPAERAPSRRNCPSSPERRRAAARLLRSKFSRRFGIPGIKKYTENELSPLVFSFLHYSAPSST